MMRILLVGAGGVGSAAVKILARRAFFEHCVVTDYDQDRAERALPTQDPRFSAARIDAPSFSIWTTIEECLNPPVIWEKGRGWFTTRPFSEPEVFDFPAGIGPVECVNVEHEEVLLIPRWVDARRVTFKYGLGNEFIEVLQVLHKVRLDGTAKVRVGPVEVSPRDVVAACLPDPAGLGAAMHGLACAGTFVTGTGKDGRPRRTYLYHVVDNAWSMAEY